MKKLLLSFLSFILAITITYAQDLQILYQGSTVVDGHYVYLTGSASDNDISQNLWVFNNSTDTLTVKVRRTEIDVTAGTLNATCWYNCPPADTAGRYLILTSMDSVTMLPGAYEYSFAAHLYPENIAGCSHFRYVFYATDGSISDSVDIYFNHGEVCTAVAAVNSIEEAAFSVFPNPANEILNVALNANVTNGEIVVTNILGTVIDRKNIAELNGNNEISVADYDNGFYFISVVSDNKTLSTRKFQVFK